MDKIQIRKNTDEKREKTNLIISKHMQQLGKTNTIFGIAKDVLIVSIPAFIIVGTVAILGNVGVEFINKINFLDTIVMGTGLSFMTNFVAFIVNGVKGEQGKKVSYSAERIVGDILKGKDYNLKYTFSKKKRKKVDKILEDIVSVNLDFIKSASNFSDFDISSILSECKNFDEYLKNKEMIIQQFKDRNFDIPVVSHSLDDVIKYAILINDDEITIEKRDQLNNVLSNSKFKLTTPNNLLNSIDDKIESTEQVISDDEPNRLKRQYLNDRLLLLLNYRKNILQATELENYAVEEIEVLEADKKSIVDETKNEAYQYTLYKRTKK